MVGDQGQGLLRSAIKALLRGKLGDPFIAAIYVEQGELSIVVGVRVLGEASAHEPVGSDVYALTIVHLLLMALIEGSAGDTDKDDYDPEMDDIPAVTARVPPRELDHRGEQILPRVAADNICAAQELGGDSGDDAGPEGERDQRIECRLIAPRPQTKSHKQDRCKENGCPGKNEIAPYALERCAAPGEQRTDAGQDQQEEANGQLNPVIEGRSHGDFVALHVLRDYREQGAPKDSETGGEQDQIIEEEARLA